MKSYQLRNGTQLDKTWLYNLYCETMKPSIEATLRDIGGFILKDKDDHLWLEMIIIEPDSQNSGVGKSAMTYVKDIATKKRLPLRLSVIKANPVMSFYIKLGFNQYDKDESFYKLEWHS